MSSQKAAVVSTENKKISNEHINKTKVDNKIIAKETAYDEQKPCQQDENKKEEEELQKEEEEKMMKEQKQAEEIAQEAYERVETKKDIRKQNINAPSNRPQESFFRGLDSNIKKNSSFIKKLKTMTEQQKLSLTQEFNGLNLTRFIQEAVAAIVEGLHKLKVADVSIVVHVCGLFHQRYAEFTSSFISELIKMFENYNCKDEEKVSNINKFRVGLRLLAELCIHGVFGNLDEGTKNLTSTLNNITTCDTETHSYLSVILSFCRHCGEDVLGIISRKQRLLSEKYDVTIPRSEIIPAARQSELFSILKVYYQSLVSHLLKEHKELQKKEKQNRRILLSKGELHDDRKEDYEKCQKSYDKLLTNTSTLAEILDQDMPDLPESESLPEEDATGGINIFNPFKLTEYDGDTGLWEDEDTRTFYENLKDLKSLVPSILYKDSSKSENNEVNQDDQKTPKDELVNGLDDESELVMSDDEDNFNDITEDDSQEEASGDDSSSDAPGGSQNNPLSNQLEQIIQRLPTCVNRDFIDDLATDFVMTCNTKGNRRKLSKALFNVPRTRFDLLPFYSRLVATLHPCMPDLADELFSSLKSEFKWHIRKKDQIYVESKVKTVRFIGELTKFDMVLKKETLHCLKILLDNFTHHNVEMACSLLETCGRYLFRSADSHIRTKNFLEQMMRKKAVQNLDSRQKTMIDNAFYYTNPPERQKVTRKQRPPMQEYVRKLIYKDLSKTTTEKVLRQLRKLPWDQEEIVTYVVRCLIRSWNIKYSNIHCAANLLAGLAPYHEQVGIEVVDGVLEEIRVGMEINIPKMNQGRISSVKYLGELYNYQLIESDVIFTVLYSFITFGNTDDGSPSILDPPEHLFRIRLACILLDTCGQYFDRGSLKRKLDCFIVYFQRLETSVTSVVVLDGPSFGKAYIWKKKGDDVWNENCPFPKEVEYMIADTVESLRPKLKLYASPEEAVKAVEELNSEYQMKIDEVVKVAVNESKPSSAPIPLSASTTNHDLHSGSPVSFQSPRAAEREEDESETGESEAEDVEVDEGQDGNKRKRSGNSLNLDDDEISEIESEQEGDVQVKGIGGPKLVACEEDTDFLSEFNKLLVDDIHIRRTENVKVPSFDVAVPMQLGKKKLQGGNEGTRVNFMVMLRKGNRQQLRDLKVPITSDLAANIREKQQEEQAEQEEVKRLVLDYNQRQEEEIYNDMIAQTRQPSPGHRFRGRRENKPKPAGKPRDPDTGFFVNRKH